MQSHRMFSYCMTSKHKKIQKLVGWEEGLEYKNVVVLRVLETTKSVIVMCATWFEGGMVFSCGLKTSAGVLCFLCMSIIGLNINQFH